MNEGKDKITLYVMEYEIEDVHSDLQRYGLDRELKCQYMFGFKEDMKLQLVQESYLVKQDDRILEDLYNEGCLVASCFKQSYTSIRDRELLVNCFVMYGGKEVWTQKNCSIRSNDISWLLQAYDALRMEDYKILELGPVYRYLLLMAKYCKDKEKMKEIRQRFDEEANYVAGTYRERWIERCRGL